MNFRSLPQPGARSWGLRATARWAGLVGALMGAWVASGPAQAQDWSRCAGEGQVCRVSGESLVRYGVEGRYAFRLVRDRVRCDNEQFGGDPAPNLRKQCEVSVNRRQSPS
jgi:hypothetical protein